MTATHLSTQRSNATSTAFPHPLPLHQSAPAELFAPGEGQDRVLPQRAMPIGKITIRSSADLPVLLEALNTADNHDEVTSMLDELRLLVPNRDVSSKDDPAAAAALERRRSSRLCLEPTRWSLEIPTLGHSRLLELSQTGARIETLGRAEIGGTYAMTIEVGESRLQVSGTVVWCRVVGMRQLGTTERTLVHQFGVRLEGPELAVLEMELGRKRHSSHTDENLQTWTSEISS